MDPVVVCWPSGYCRAHGLHSHCIRLCGMAMAPCVLVCFFACLTACLFACICCLPRLFACYVLVCYAVHHGVDPGDTGRFLINLRVALRLPIASPLLYQPSSWCTFCALCEAKMAVACLFVGWLCVLVLVFVCFVFLMFGLLL